jgi:RimJ/RimL family protein N-acetyltransferase
MVNGVIRTKINQMKFTKFKINYFSEYKRNESIFTQKMKCEHGILQGTHIKIIPLDYSHLDDLYEAGRFPEIWQYNTGNVTCTYDMKKYIDKAMDAKTKGLALPYVIHDKNSNSLVGSTRFYNIDYLNYHMDLGYTWITPKFQRSYVNSESKLLMLGQAFEKWNAIRVGFRVSPKNIISQNSVERLGAKREGVLRNVMILEDKKLRDSVCFSILDSEWQDVKNKLLEKLNKNYNDHKN